MHRETWHTHLCFHGIGVPQRTREDGEALYWISEDMFRRTLDLVVGRTDIRLSFDDGNASDVEIGLPELLSRGLTATFFPVADRLDRPGSVSRESLRGIAAAGMAVGSHGMYHRPWRGLDEPALQVELDDARDSIAAAAGRPVDTVACPRGAYDRRVLAALRRRNYTAVYTSDRAPARDGSWLQPRFSVRVIDELEDVEAELALRDRAGARLTGRARTLMKGLR